MMNHRPKVDKNLHSQFFCTANYVMNPKTGLPYIPEEAYETMIDDCEKLKKWCEQM